MMTTCLGPQTWGAMLHAKNLKFYLAFREQRLNFKFWPSKYLTIFDSWSDLLS